MSDRGVDNHILTGMCIIKITQSLSFGAKRNSFYKYMLDMIETKQLSISYFYFFLSCCQKMTRTAHAVMQLGFLHVEYCTIL